MERFSSRIGTLFFAFLAILFTTLGTSAQQTITIGTGNVTNNFNEYPCPYGNFERGARHQMLILASELQAAGMTAGDISSVAFDIEQEAANQLEGFTVSIGATSITQMTAAWTTGTTALYGPLNYVDQNGWNVHPFTTDFAWDGTSNIVIETCFYNSQSNFNPQFNQSSTPFTSTLARSTPNPNICTAATGTLITYNQRPNMQFEWTVAEAPPIGNYDQSTVFSCDGVVQFTDLTTFAPTEWAWDFGDGNTSTDQDPEHIYVTDGTFTPTLTVTNAFGTDTYSGASITISVNGPAPGPACTPASTGTVAGFGLTSVTIGSMTTNSAEAAIEGYADRTCQIETVLIGTTLQLALVTGTSATHNVRIWIDWDNSGTFISGELVLTQNSVFTASGSVTIPAFATLNTPLRVRVMADYDFSPMPQPCLDPQYGQAEDYALLVQENVSAPVASFSADPQFSCTGAVQFTDASQNVPSSWTWSFGDGGSSNDQDPLHTYTTSGTYTVQLTVTNIHGDDFIVLTDLITVDLTGQLTAASCTPVTQSYCCGFGLMAFNFAGIASISGDGIEGYQDRSCGNVGMVTEGTSYPISAITGGTLSHDVRVWIDLDNDGIFAGTEQVWSALDQVNPSGSVIIPTASVFGTPVRVRVAADVVGETTDACESPLYGQMEDFAVIISPNQNPPTALFTGSPTNTCTGFVQFTDASLNAPTAWAWDFGDGGTSVDPSPLYQYMNPGNYSVSLTVTNANGSDMQTNTNYITFNEPWSCDTLEIPGAFSEESNACQGVLADDGGPNGPYSTFGDGTFTIAPTTGDVVVLSFSQFAWGNNQNRFLAVYDGPDNTSPLIGQFNGNGLIQLPNNGVITSTGPSITLEQVSNAGGPQNNAGFLLTWSCSYVGIGENVGPLGAVWPQPAGDLLNLSFNQAAGSGWRIVMHTILGEELRSERVALGSTSLSLNTEDLLAGSYVLSLETPEARWGRMIILN
ncbi:MAG: PKD domain-containing protein [Flavobacteriales bacterium]|nr:PKD domain-containing protein [Flavobacteriales bacterium]